ncbi:MAG: hypothetical protein ACTSP9_13205 [Promethearchaeota archaeon]
MPKVYINGSTKLDGKLVPPGEYEVSAEKKKELDKKGLLGEIKKSNKPSNQKDIDELVARNIELEKGADKALKEENETLKSENEELRKAVKDLAGDKEENKSLLSKFGF